MKVLGVQLRQEVYSNDAWKIIGWLEDEEVTRYLNEDRNVSDGIKQAMNRVNMPILTHLFNKNGSFFIVSKEEEPVGFLRLVPRQNNAEMVIVIGDRKNWGKGLGSSAILQGLKHAFFEWRVSKVIVNISPQNERSVKAFKKVGFKHDHHQSGEEQYSITLDEFLKLVA